MSKVICLVLFGLLVCLSGTSVASPNSASTDDIEPIGCDVTIRGVHGGATGTIELQLGESDVRNRVGWWTTIGGGIVSLETRQSFSEVVSLDFGCNAHRRYRFYFEANVDGTRYQYMYYFPNENDFTQQTVIDLGDVSRFFDAIEPAPPADPSDQDTPASGPISGIDLQGEWIRRDSNHDPNDGMRIEVTNDEAVLTFVPETASSAHWHVGEVLWQEIGSDGVMRVLGSNDQYFDAQMTAEGQNRIHIDIHYNGAGNDQSWERSTRIAACWPESYMEEYGQRTPGMWARAIGLQAAARDSLYAARDAQAAIQTFAISPTDEWVIVAANKPCYSSGFPSAARAAIDGFIAQGRQIDVVAFGPGGRWVVVADDLIRRTENVSVEIRDEIRRAQEQDRRLTSFAFSDDPDGGWIFTAGGVAYWGDEVNVDIRMAVAAALQGNRPIHEISIGPGGAWALIAEDWYASRGLPGSLLEQLDRYRTDEGRRISHVVLAGDEGEEKWALFSNQAEPRPDPTDLINVFEHGLSGDSTIYQKMRERQITGLSIAVVRNNEVEWARGYGLREFDIPESFVYPSTVFDAASISKPLTGAAALRLVDDRDIELTEVGILMDLAGDELPSANALRALRADSIHLAHLMRHCAGIDNQKGVSGAEGFLLQAHLPTLSEMFLGQAPARLENSIVRVDSVRVGEDNDYSGANSLLIQSIIEHYADGGYDGQMGRLLDDLNMRSSTYRTDFWERMLRERFAHGHTTFLNTINKTLVRVYPNQAAANLRTTATDLAQFVIMLNQDGMYDGRIILQAQTVDQFVGRDGIGPQMGVAEAACAENVAMQLHINSWNLGSMSNDEIVYHGGLHNGYRTYMYSLPQREEGVVILSTGEAADAAAFSTEIRDALESTYGWPTLW